VIPRPRCPESSPSFTEEIDCWSVHGPINFYHPSGAYPKRIEPRLDGCVIEVYEGEAEFEILGPCPQLRSRRPDTTP
jgi:hypothetical protein